MSFVTVADVQEQLNKWQAGELTGLEVEQWARATRFRADYEPETIGVKEVIALLGLIEARGLRTDHISVLTVALRSPEPAFCLDRFLLAGSASKPQPSSRPVRTPTPPREPVWGHLFLLALGVVALVPGVVALFTGRVTDLEEGWLYRSREPGPYWTLTLIFISFGSWLTLKAVRDLFRR